MKTLNYILFGILLAGLVFVAWKSYTLKEKVEFITVTDTVKICDTIVDFQPQYVYVDHFDTTLLPVLISDTVTDTMLVQIPKYGYIYDTTVTYTDYETSLRAVISGFDVTLDTLSINTKITQQKPSLPTKKWYEHIAPACGVGICTDGKFGLFVGIGYAL